MVPVVTLNPPAAFNPGASTVVPEARVIDVDGVTSPLAVDRNNDAPAREFDRRNVPAWKVLAGFVVCDAKRANVGLGCISAATPRVIRNPRHTFVTRFKSISTTFGVQFGHQLSRILRN